MKAILLPAAGEATALTLGDAPAPRLRAGTVRIRVRASGVNRADILQRKGRYPPPAGESDILGLEVAGDVIESAEDAKRFPRGARVMALLAGGGYAEEVVVDEGLVLPLPDRLSYVEGAAIPEVFLTAHHNLFTLGGAGAGSDVLLHAAASGVGTAGIQLLSGLARRVFGTVGSREKAEAIRRLGAFPIEYQRESFREIVLRETNGRGVDVVLDPVGASYLDANLHSLAVEGRHVLIGTMGGGEASVDLRLLLSRRIRLIGSTLRALPIEQKRRVVAAFHAQFFAALEAGRIGPVVDTVVPAADARLAHERMEANRNVGKIVLSWG